MSRPIVDLAGKRFGLLLVLTCVGRDKCGSAIWECRCDCGRTKIARGACLSRGDVGSCGCAKKGGRPQDRPPKPRPAKDRDGKPGSRGSFPYCIKLRDQYGFDRVEVLDAVSPKHAAAAAEFVSGDTALVIVPCLTREVTRIIGRCSHCGDLVSDAEKSQTWCGELLCEDCRR